MTASNQSKFPWRKGSLLLLVLIGTILAYDIRKYGSFEASGTGKFLKRSGALSYGQQILTTTKEYSSKGLEYIEASSPEYYKATVDTCKPYIKLAGDVYLSVRNLSMKIYENAVVYVGQNGPVVLETIEHYAPGMLEEIQVRSNQGLQLVKVYSSLIGEKIVEHSNVTIKWLQQNVFVGKLSPENIQSYASWALDTTQTAASQTYNWVYQKVQTLSKVP